jgi:hypothetical protein
MLKRSFAVLVEKARDQRVEAVGRLYLDQVGAALEYLQPAAGNSLVYRSGAKVQ